MGQVTVHEDLEPTIAEKTFASASAYGVELVDLGAPILADADRVVTALDPIADGALTVAAQPDVPRNLTALVVDANDSASCVLTITGRDLAGALVQEVMTVALGVGKSFVGTKIFAVVDSAVVTGTAGAAAGDTIQVGVGNVIGLPKEIANDLAIKHVFFNVVPVTPDAIATGRMTSGVDVNGATYDGSKVLRVAYRPGE